MIKKLSLMNFKRFCDENAPITFIYDTENQPGGETQDIKIIQKYTKTAFMLNPNRIMFANSQGTFCLNRVKYVGFYDKDYCGGFYLV